ncbi:MAG: GAF domain-containing protein [Anaerolineae bacterium]|nr:GAF domain-containing protein [Anaerolineae bacterium]
MEIDPTTDQHYLQQLDRIISTASKANRQRLTTYVRRYMSPLLIDELFEQGKLGMLMEAKEIARATVVIADVRGFTPQTLDYERRGRSLRQVAELLEKFFDDALETVFEYKGIMGEFSGDKFVAIFGMPVPQPDDTDRAVMSAIEIYDNAIRLNRHLRMTRQHHLAFDIGIGISTGGPVWIGDIGSDWRRELTMIGTTINLAARVEELTKSEEFRGTPGYNIIMTESTTDSITPKVKQYLNLQDFPPRQLRGLGEIKYRLYKLVGHDRKNISVIRYRIDTATQAVVDAIAQTIESIQEREEAFRLGMTLQDIGQAISSSLQLDDILESVMDGIQVFLYSTTASLLLIEEGSNRLRFKAVRPNKNMPALKSFEDRLVIGTGIVGYVAETGESLCLYDAQRDPRFYSGPDTKTGFETRSVLCTPIRLEDRIIGVIQVIDSQEGKFSPSDSQILEAIAAFTASAIRNARQHAEVAEAEMLAAMSIVTSDIAHMLKNDVGLIQMASQSLLTKLNTPETDLSPDYLRRKIERISRKADDLLNTMEDIRSPFSDLNLEETNLRDLLESTLQSVLTKTGQSESITIRRSYRDLPPIRTDKTRLSAVFFKIIENAIKAMEGQDNKMLILDLWQPEHSHIRVGIADTGPGIPPTERSALFRPVSRHMNAQSKSANGGWGYGLWSSRLFVKVLGGIIFLDEVYSDGTRMIVDLPIEPVSLGLET